MRIVTINLKGMELDWQERRSQALINELKKLEPDIVGMQECAICSRDALPYDQVQEIGRAIGLPYEIYVPYGNAVEVHAPEFGGVALLSRWPICRVRTLKLPPGEIHPPDERTALTAVIRGPEGDFLLANTHLSWRAEEAQKRHEQILTLLSFLKIEPGIPGPFIIGDFNATEDEPAIRELKSHFTDAFHAVHPESAGITWSARLPSNRAFPMPDRRVDYIFCPQNIHVRNSRVVLDSPAPVYPSDHFGVCADVEWL